MDSFLGKLKNLEKQVVFSFFLFILIFLGLGLWSDLQKTGETLLSFNFSLVPLILGLSLLNYFLRFLRFRYYLWEAKFKINPKDAFLIFFSGLSMTVTPGKIGELLKAYLIKIVGKNHFSLAVPVIVAERLTDGLAAIILTGFGLVFFKYGLPLFLAGIAICLIIILALRNGDFFLKILKFFWFGQKLIPGFANFFQTGRILVSFKTLTLGTLFGCLAWGAESLSLAFILFGLGIPLSGKILLASLFIFCFSSLLGFLSLLPAGIGVTEGSLTGLLILLLGFSKTLAVSTTIFLRLFTLWFGVSLGIVSLFFFLKKLNNR